MVLSYLVHPVGATSFEEEVVNERINKAEELIEKLRTIEDPYTEYVLLRNCLALPKMSYTMRTVDPQPHKDLMQRFDNAVRSGIERILGKPLNGKQWTQASLPFSLGGLGLRSAVSHSPGAYISSLTDSSSIAEDVIGSSKEFEDDDL